MNVVGHVAALWRYPVKSMRGEPLEQATFGRDGIPGDRGVALIDEQTGNVLSAKRVAALLGARAVARPGGPVIVFPDGRALYAADAAAELSAWLGRGVRASAAPQNGERPVIESEDDTFRGRPGGFFD